MTGNELWRDVHGYSGYYQISNKGRVRSLDRDVIDSKGRKYSIKGKDKALIQEKDGYKVFRVSIKGKQKLLKVHREVLKSFNPIDHHKLLMVNHKNNIKSDNKVENLEWVTAKGNSRHYRGKIGAGKYNRSVKLSDTDVMNVAMDFLDKMPLEDITRKYKVNRSIVDGIVNLRTNIYIIRENFDVDKISLELRRRKFSRSKELEKKMVEFFEKNKFLIRHCYRSGMSREYMTRVFEVPETWVRFFFDKIKIIDGEKIRRDKRLSDLIKLKNRTKKHCDENNISTEEYMKRLEKEIPLELIERNLIS